MSIPIKLRRLQDLIRDYKSIVSNEREEITNVMTLKGLLVMSSNHSHLQLNMHICAVCLAIVGKFFAIVAFTFQSRIHL